MRATEVAVGGAQQRALASKGQEGATGHGLRRLSKTEGQGVNFLPESVGRDQALTARSQLVTVVTDLGYVAESDDRVLLF